MGKESFMEKYVLRLVTSVGQRKNSESPWGIEPKTFCFRVPMLYNWAAETTVSEVQYEVHMTHVLHISRISNVDSVMFVNRIRDMVSFKTYHLCNSIYESFIPYFKSTHIFFFLLPLFPSWYKGTEVCSDSVSCGQHGKTVPPFCETDYAAEYCPKFCDLCNRLVSTELMFRKNRASWNVLVHVKRNFLNTLFLFKSIQGMTV